MLETRMLYDAFNIYYKKGMDALKENNNSVAKRNLYLASETMFNLAKKSEGELKEARFKRAEELMKLADKIPENNEVVISANESCVSNEASNLNIVENNEYISLEDAEKELQNLEGLSTVKQQVSDIVDQLKISKLRNQEGLPIAETSNHMVFLGNPGTGKTTVARIIGKIYKALGLLSKGHLVEVDRSDLVAGYVGQTAIKTKEVINKAKGGVLFIDEAYALKKGDGNDFGQEAIDTLNKYMEDYRNDLVVIVAGYDQEMKSFINSNVGLRSRFKTFIKFDDYTGKELFNIFLILLKDNKYIPTDEASSMIRQYLYSVDRTEFSGNARDVRNLFENIIKLQSRRLATIQNPSKTELLQITIADLPEEVRVNSSCKIAQTEKAEQENTEPEQAVLENTNKTRFNWDSLPAIRFEDIAGLDQAKEIVNTKVLLPLKYPELFEGYMKKSGGGLFLYGAPGTGKTMIAAAIANEIGAKFCSVKPSDLLNQGVGNNEKAVKTLFAEARQFPCSVIYFDEIDAIAQKNTRSSISRQLRSELLAQIQGVESYNSETKNTLFLICSTNKPWEVDSAFVRPGRFGTAVYVGLPDEDSRRYLINKRFKETKEKGIVSISDDIDVESFVQNTNGYNGSDIVNVLDRIDEISASRALDSGCKIITNYDIIQALHECSSSVQREDIERLLEWKEQN